MGMEQRGLGHWEGRGRTCLHAEQKDQNPPGAAAEEEARRRPPFQAAGTVGNGILAAV